MRAVMNRMYYAMFYAVLALLQEKVNMPRLNQVHFHLFVFAKRVSLLIPHWKNLLITVLV